jgi:hypothetical protein
MACNGQQRTDSQLLELGSKMKVSLGFLTQLKEALVPQLETEFSGLPERFSLKLSSFSNSLMRLSSFSRIPIRDLLGIFFIDGFFKPLELILQFPHLANQTG